MSDSTKVGTITVKVADSGLNQKLTELAGHLEAARDILDQLERFELDVVAVDDD